MRHSKRAGVAAILAFLMAAPVVSAQTAAPAKAAQCFACHGANGIATMPDAPNLAGQNEIYLAKALQDFRSGARQHEVMTLMAKNLSDQDIAQLASYFGKLEMAPKAK